MSKFINTLAQRLQWDVIANKYPITIKEDCIRNAFREFLQEEDEKQAIKQQRIAEAFHRENPQY